MPTYPYSDNMYSGLDDSDVEEQPREDGGGNRNTHGYGHGAALGASSAGSGAGGFAGRTEVGVDSRHQHDQHVAGHDEDQVLSPTDGYFGRSGDSSSSDYDAAYPIGNNNPDNHPLSPSHQYQSSSVDVHATPSSHYPAAASSQVPHVPNVWVNDPSLEQGSTAESKAREAQEERELNRRRAGRPHPSNFASLPPHAAGYGGTSTFPSLDTTSTTPSTTSGPGQSRYAYGPGLSYAPPSQRYTPSSSSAAPSRSHRSGTIYSERSSLFNEAPPAYTPSPTSPTTASSNYQTIRPSNNMGRISESESRGLLASHEYQSLPQDMGGQADDDYTYTRTGSWRDRVRSRVSSVNGRTCKLVALGIVLLFVTVGFLVSSFVGVKDEVSTYIPFVSSLYQSLHVLRVW